MEKIIYMLLGIGLAYFFLQGDFFEEQVTVTQPNPSITITMPEPSQQKPENFSPPSRIDALAKEREEQHQSIKESLEEDENRAGRRSP